MNSTAFRGDFEQLVTGVKRGQLKRISSDFAYYGPRTATLWLSTGEGFQISSVMEEIAESAEIGILQFHRVLQPSPEETFFDLPWTFKNGGTVTKLVIKQNNDHAESGILLRSNAGDELVIVPASFPRHIYIGGIPLPSQEATPEYSLSRYLRETA